MFIGHPFGRQPRRLRNDRGISGEFLLEDGEP